MKTLFFSFFFIFSFSCFAQEGYRIKIKVKGWEKKELQLGYYQEDKKFSLKTSTTDRKGEVIFSDKGKLPRGIYLIILPQQGFFDFLINEDQEFSLKTDTSDLISKMEVSGNDENKYFFDYQKSMIKNNLEIVEIEKKLKNFSAKNNSEKIDSAMWRQKIKNIQEESEHLWKKVVNEHPNSLLSALLSTMNAYDEDAEKFLNRIIFAESGLLRTPFYFNIIRLWIKRNIEKNSAYIISENDRFIEKSRANKEVFQYTTLYLLNFYNQFYKAGINDVVVHLAEKYFLNPPAQWLDTAIISSISQRVRKLKVCAIGQAAPDITAENIAGEFISLLQVNKKYTFLFFWSTGCGHCEKAINLFKQYLTEIKENDMEIFGLNTEQNKEEWKKYVSQMEMKWINCIDPNSTTNFRELYYVYSTPILYVLDSKKTIIARCIGENEIEFLVKKMLNK